MASMASMETINAAVTAYYQALRAMDAKAWAETFAPNGVSHDPEGTPPHAGREAIRQFLQGILRGCEKFGLTEDNTYIAGQGAAVKWTGRLTAKNGGAVTFAGIDVLEVNDQGKIKYVHAYWDPGPVMAVLRG
jgi:steroid Delta-isomerase